MSRTANAMLIMDMPKNCDECDLKESYCHVDDNDTCRAGGCPLREVPQKDTKQYADSYKYGKGRQRGRNECIDELLGGAEHG